MDLDPEIESSSINDDADEKLDGAPPKNVDLPDLGDETISPSMGINNVKDDKARNDANIKISQVRVLN